MPEGNASGMVGVSGRRSGGIGPLRWPPIAPHSPAQAQYAAREGTPQREAVIRGLFVLAIFCAGTLLIESSLSLDLARRAMPVRLAASLLALAAAALLRRPRGLAVECLCICVPIMAAMALTLALSRWAPMRVSGAYLLVAPLIASRFIAAVPMRLPIAAVLAASALGCESAVLAVSPPPLDLASNHYQLIFAALLLGVSLAIAVRDEAARQERFLLLLHHEQTLEEMRRLNARLLHLSTTDMLTGLPNRRQFELTLEQAWCDPATGSLGIALIDVDHFKLYNDTAGHAAGDGCLRQVADAVAQCLSESQHAARYGGEEFTVLLPNMGIADLVAFGTRLRRAVSDAAWPHPGLPANGRVTISVGLAWRAATDRRGTPEDVLREADGALYAAKHAGRDRVVLVSQDRFAHVG